MVLMNEIFKDSSNGLVITNYCKCLLHIYIYIYLIREFYSFSS